MADYSHVMNECIEKARAARGFTGTNPLVGAAVIKGGKIFFGIHEKFGSAHAEVNAINSAKHDAMGADLLVTLEPCSTYGKTPPCTELIIKSGIKKVVIGALDPNPKHAGVGVKLLREAGIEVEVGVEAEKCAYLIENFAKSVLSKKPYVTLKIGMSLDGKIATKTGDSKWITSDKSREEVFRIRQNNDAVLVGINTVLADDPMLNVRIDGVNRQPIRVILDSQCRMPLESKLVKSAQDIPVILFVSEDSSKDNIKKLQDKGLEVVILKVGEKKRINLDEVLKYLHSRNIMDLLVEGGSSVFGSFIDNNEADALKVFIAPKIIGSHNGLSSIGGSGISLMKEAKEFASMKSSPIGCDILIETRIKDYMSDIIRLTKSFRG